MIKPGEISRLYGSLPKGMAANILRLNVIKFSKWFTLIMPVIVPFYKYNGLSLSEIMVLKSVYSIVIVALELPSGYFADVLGRKKTLVKGAFLGTAGFVIYSITHNYIGFLLAEIALGAGQSLISGADSAILYDTLAAGRKEKDYARYEGLNASIGNFSEAFAGIAGGALALISLRMPFYIQVIIASTAIPAAITLKEPRKSQRVKNRIKLTDIITVLDQILIKEKNLRYNLLFSSIIGATTLIMAWFAQPLFEEIGIKLAFYGILWTALNIITGISSIAAHRVERLLGDTNTLTLIAIATPCLMIITGISPLIGILPMLFAFYIIRGIATPVLKDYVNQSTSPGVRATVMSLRDLIIRILFAMLAPLGGWISDSYNLKTGLAFTGIVIFVLSVTTLIMFLRHRDRL
jgi:MFS family permease